MPKMCIFRHSSTILLFLFAFLIPRFFGVETAGNEENSLKNEENLTKKTVGDERENIQRKMAEMGEEAKINRVEESQIQIFDQLLALPEADDRYRTILGYCNGKGGMGSILVDKGLGKLHYSLFYGGKRLKIRKIGANNLPEMDLNKKTDAYVEVHLYPGYSVEKTKHVENNLSPEFPEELIFENLDSKSLKGMFLVFVVKDKDFGSLDDVIGKVVQPLAGLEEEIEFEGEVDIQRPFPKNEIPLSKEHFVPGAIQIEKKKLEKDFGQISFEMNYDPKLGVLKIDQIKGHKLTKKDFFTSDPYVEFYIFPGFEMRSTETIEKNLNPQFGSEISFLIEPAELASKILVVKMVDKDKTNKDDPIGQTAIELKDLNAANRKRVHKTLEYPFMKTKLPFNGEQIEFEFRKQEGMKIKNITLKGMGPEEMRLHFRLFKQCVQNLLEKNRPRGINLVGKRFLAREMTKEFKEFLSQFLLPRPIFLAQRIDKLMAKEGEGDVRALLEVASTESWEDLVQAKYYQNALAFHQMSNFRLLDFIPSQAHQNFSGIVEFLNQRFSGKRSQNLKEFLAKKVKNISSNKLGKIIYKLDFDSREKKLNIFIVEAKGLPVMDNKTKNSDPYIKLELLPDLVEGGMSEKMAKMRTVAQPRNLNPVYNAHFAFEGISWESLGNKILKLAVFDSDEEQRKSDSENEDDPIGELAIELGQIDWKRRERERAGRPWKEQWMDWEMGFIQPKSAGYLKYAMKIENSKLSIEILEARDLALENEKSVNPFVEISILGREKALGKTAKKKEMIFRESFNNLKLEEWEFRGGILKLSIYDEQRTLNWKGTKKFKLIGAIYIPLGKISSGKGRVQKWEEIEAARFGRVKCGIGYNFEEEKIIVKMVEAGNLASKDSDGKSEPYVKYWLILSEKEREEKEGKRMGKTLDPVFNEIMEFEKVVGMDDLRGKMVEIVVYDHDNAGIDDVIGKIEFGLEDIFKSEIWEERRKKYEEWKKEGKMQKNEEIGEIMRPIFEYNGRKKIGMFAFGIKLAMNVFEEGVEGGKIILTVGKLPSNLPNIKKTSLGIVLSNANGSEWVELVKAEKYMENKKYTIPLVHFKERKLILNFGNIGSKKTIGIVEINLEEFIDGKKMKIFGGERKGEENWRELEKYEKNENWAEKLYGKLRGKYLPVKEAEFRKFLEIADEMDEMEKSEKMEEEGGQKRMEYFGQKILRLLKSGRRRKGREWLHQILILRQSVDLDRIVGKMRGMERRKALQMIDRLTGYGKWRNAMKMKHYDRVYAHCLRKMLHIENAAQLTFFKEFVDNYWEYVDDFLGRLAGQQELYHFDVGYVKEEQKRFFVIPEEEDRLAVNITLPETAFTKGRMALLEKLENEGVEGEMDEPEGEEDEEEEDGKKGKNGQTQQNDSGDENEPKNLVPLTKSVFLSDLLYSMNEKLMDRLNLIILGRVRQLNKKGITHKIASETKFAIEIEEEGKVGERSGFEGQNENEMSNPKDPEFVENIKKEHFEAAVLMFRANYLALGIALQMWPIRKKEAAEIENSKIEKKPLKSLEDLKDLEGGKGILYGMVVEEGAWPREKEAHFGEMAAKLKIKLEQIDRNLLENYNHQFRIMGVRGTFEKHFMQIGLEMLQKLGYNFYKNLVDEMVIEKIGMLEKLRDELDRHREEDGEYLTTDEVEISNKNIQLYDGGKIVEESGKIEELSGIERFLQNKFNWLNAKVESAHRKAMRGRSRFGRFFFSKLSGFMAQLAGLFTGSTPRLRFFLRTFMPLPYYGFKLAKVFAKWGRKMMQNLWAMLKGKMGQLGFKADMHNVVMDFEKELDGKKFEEIVKWSVEMREEEIIGVQESFGSKFIGDDEMDEESMKIIKGEKCLTDPNGMKDFLSKSISFSQFNSEQEDGQGNYAEGNNRTKREAIFAFAENSLVRSKRKKKWSKSSLSGSNGGGKSNAAAGGGGTGDHSGGTVWSPGGNGNKQATILGGNGSSGSGKKSTIVHKHHGGDDSSFWDHKAPLMIGWVSINAVLAIAVTAPSGYIFWSIKCEKGQVWYKQLGEAFKQFGQILKQKAKNVWYFLEAMGIKMSRKIAKKMDPDYESKPMDFGEYIEKRQRENGDNWNGNGRMLLESKCGKFIAISIGVVHLIIFVLGIVVIYSM